MMLGKDYMLAIVIVNYEGRCICRSRLETTPWGRSWNAGLSVSVCVCLCVSMCPSVGICVCLLQHGG